jgi:hypothetical protein
MKTIIRTLAIALTLGVVSFVASTASASNYGGGGGYYPLTYVPPTQGGYGQSQWSGPSQWGGSQWSGKQWSGKQSFTPSQYSAPKKGKKGRFSY